MQPYFQLVDTEARAWAGDHPTLDEALTAVREWAEHEGDVIADDLALCRLGVPDGGLIAEGPELLRMARESASSESS